LVLQNYIFRDNERGGMDSDLTMLWIIFAVRFHILILAVLLATT